eukprot:gene15-2095_t
MRYECDMVAIEPATAAEQLGTQPRPEVLLAAAPICTARVT